MKRIVCILMSLLLVAAYVPFAAAEADGPCDCGKAPIVHVFGIGNSMYDGDKKVFPPQGDTIAKTVFTALPLLPALLRGELNAKQEERAFRTAATIFAPIAFDKNGDPATPAVAYFNYPEEIDHESGEPITFDYDWRLDPFVVASRLNDFIQYVKEKTGHDGVYLVAESMGAMILTTYLSVYGTKDVYGAVWMNGAYKGVATCSESYSDQNSFSAEGFYTYLTQQFGMFENSPLLCDLFTGLYESGLFESVLTPAVKISRQLADDGTLTRFMQQYLGRIPGFWGLVSAEDYPAARDFVFPTAESQEEYAVLLERLDRYYNEVSSRVDEIMNATRDATGRVGVICGYGEVIVPVTKDNTRQSDSVILTEDESNGAICAPIGQTLGEDYVQAVDDGHNHISADRVIDASACIFPDNTWFVKFAHHKVNYEAFSLELVQNIFWTDGFDVFTDPKFPQFVVRDPDTNTFSPLTPDNGGEKAVAPGFAAKVFRAIFRGIRVFVDLFAKVPACLTGLTVKE